MLESFDVVKNTMEYKKISPDEQKSRGILGRLVGIIASFTKPTRNGRLYTEELWDKTFNNPIMKEKLVNRCIFGELGHPVDRQEIDMEKIAICMAEEPKKGSDGNLYGVFDILDTPNGRILKTMCDYGCNIGVSSRGSGDTVEDYNGNETVEPDTYECECWDAVLLPAVKAARPVYVTESLNTGKTLKKALQEALENSSDADRKTMEATLNELAVDYKQITEEEEPEQLQIDSDEFNTIVVERVKELLLNLAQELVTMVNIDEEIDDSIFNNSESKMYSVLKTACTNLFTENNPEEGLDIDVESEPAQAAENSGADIVQELQESLLRQQELEDNLKSLQEKLSVCYTKETRYSTVLDSKIKELSQSNIDHQQLREEYKKLDDENTKNLQVINKLRNRIQNLHEKLAASTSSQTKLNESITARDSRIKHLLNDIESINSDNDTKVRTLTEEKNHLSESLEECKKDLQIVRSQNSSKLIKAQELVERYKTIAKTAVDKYIALQAKRLGINASDIKSKLNENYSFNDIDTVCESLQKYSLAVNSLPFNVSSKPVKMKITESKKTSQIIENNDDGFDDGIDDTLKSFL